ncbi:hypothetical protein F8M41_024383 [Gigaspora margarita]|uniref:Uncharacterized protein n=1 Tax=Gigaspora margarita TaxID=4874 RepID=A0A8H3XL91_GIGMA|nr:hypothetical protein F8M41_024383 [Gigaspora margarita]
MQKIEDLLYTQFAKRDNLRKYYSIFLLDNSISGIRFNNSKDPKDGSDELDLSYWENWKLMPTSSNKNLKRRNDANVPTF